MNNILSEKDYLMFLLEYLEQDNSFIIQKVSQYDRRFATERELMFQFLNGTQPDEMKAPR